VRKQNGVQNASPQNDRRSAGVKQNAKQNAPALHALAIFAPESARLYRDKKIYCKSFVL
jgi:hypothetical protein